MNPEPGAGSRVEASFKNIDAFLSFGYCLLSQPRSLFVLLSSFFPTLEVFNPVTVNDTEICCMSEATAEATKSVLFRKQLEVRNTSEPAPISSNTLDNGFVDIRALSKKVDKFRKHKLDSSMSGITKHILIPRHNAQNLTLVPAVERNVLDISQKLRGNAVNSAEMSPTTSAQEKIRRLPSSTKRPEYCVPREGGYVMQLQRVLDTARATTTHAIRKDDGKTRFEDVLVGKVKKIQVLSESLRIVEVINGQESNNIHGEDRDANLDMVWKIGLVGLWNEWIEVKLGERILFPDIVQTTTALQWSFKWKKLVS